MSEREKAWQYTEAKTKVEHPEPVHIGHQAFHDPEKGWLDASQSGSGGRSCRISQNSDEYHGASGAMHVHYSSTNAVGMTINDYAEDEEEDESLFKILVC